MPRVVAHERAAAAEPADTPVIGAANAVLGVAAQFSEPPALLVGGQAAILFEDVLQELGGVYGGPDRHAEEATELLGDRHHIGGDVDLEGADACGLLGGAIAGGVLLRQVRGHCQGVVQPRIGQAFGLGRAADVEQPHGLAGQHPQPRRLGRRQALRPGLGVHDTEHA